MKAGLLLFVTLSPTVAPSSRVRLSWASSPDDGFLGEESGAQPGSSWLPLDYDPIDARAQPSAASPGPRCVRPRIRVESRSPGRLPPAPSRRSRPAGDGAFPDDRPIQGLESRHAQGKAPFYIRASPGSPAPASRRRSCTCGRRRSGSALGDFCGFVLVAQGSGEIMIEQGVHAWDPAPSSPSSRKPAAKITAWDGRATSRGRTCWRRTDYCTRK